MLAASRGGEPAGHEAIYDLRAFEVTRRRHDFEKRAVEGLRPLMLREVGGARLAEQCKGGFAK